MSRPTAWSVHASTLLVGGTGLIYGWMRYLVRPSDEFAIVNHPQQPLLKALHILAAPLLLFGCGVLWRNHVWGRIRAGHRARRRSGIVLAVLLAPMVASGYLLQTTVDEGWRWVWILTHGISASLWLLIYLGHQLLARDPEE